MVAVDLDMCAFRTRLLLSVCPHHHKFTIDKRGVSFLRFAALNLFQIPTSGRGGCGAVICQAESILYFKALVWGE
jgi:hypothetical protein